MATRVLQPYSNSKSLLTFLMDDDKDSQVYALENILSDIDYLWHEMINHIEYLIELQVNAENTTKTLISFLIAKIFYHKEDYENALNYILESGDYFQINQRSKFTDKMITIAVDRY